MIGDPCSAPGCDLTAVVETDDGPYCFVHMPVVDQVDYMAEVEAAATDGSDASFSEDVVAGLAAIILDHTAMTMLDTDTATEEAMRSLAEATNMPYDFAAGILLATTWLVGAGAVDSAIITTGAEMFEGQAAGEPIPHEVAKGGDGNARCDYCGEDHTTEEHDQLYPLNNDNNESEVSSDDDENEHSRA